jgi:hypothetical protein
MIGSLEACEGLLNQDHLFEIFAISESPLREEAARHRNYFPGGNNIYRLSSSRDIGP